MNTNWFSQWQKQRLERAATLPQDRFQYGLSIAVDAPEGAEFTPSKQEITADGKLKSTLEKITDTVDANYYFAQMAGCAAPEVYVFEKGEQKHTISAAGNMFSIIVARAGAEVTIENRMEGNKFTGHTLLLIAEDDATIDCEHFVSGTGPFFVNTIGVAEKDAWITVVENHQTKAFIKSHTTFFLGEHAEGKVDTRMRADTGAVYDICHIAQHERSYSRSQLLSRGVADAGGRIVYRGDIKIQKGIGGVEGHQDGRFLMLSEGAEIDAIPALDIDSKDVVCSHAVSITYPREDLLYYVALRGFDRDRGRALLVDSLLSG